MNRGASRPRWKRPTRALIEPCLTPQRHLPVLARTDAIVGALVDAYVVVLRAQTTGGRLVLNASGQLVQQRHAEVERICSVIQNTSKIMKFVAGRLVQRFY